jgi:hypothetical protein
LALGKAWERKVTYKKKKRMKSRVGYPAGDHFPKLLTGQMIVEMTALDQMLSNVKVSEKLAETCYQQI